MRWRLIFSCVVCRCLICRCLISLCLALPLGGCLTQDGPIQTSRVEEDVLKSAVHIIVAGEKDLSGGFVVKENGTVQLDLLGAVGLSVTGLQEQLRPSQ